MIDVVLPNLGFGMEEGRLIRWLRQPGDVVAKGDVLVEIEGDKAAVELEATSAGTLDSILVQAEMTVPVGTVLARLRTDADLPAPAPASAPAEARATPVAKRYAQKHGLDPATLTGTGRGGAVTRDDVLQALAQQPPAPGESRANGAAPGRVLAAPAVRRAAKLAGIDLARLQPTGQFGQVTRADLEKAVQAAAVAPAAPPAAIAPAAQAPAPVERSAPVQPAAAAGRQEVPLSPMRRAIARRVTQALHEIPHFYVTSEMDLTDALPKLPAGVGLNALLIYLTVQTLRAHPAFNVTYEDGHLYQSASVDLSLAVALDQGLMTPTLVGAENYSLIGLAHQSRALIERARTGKLTPVDMQNGSFTLSNLGIIQQVDHFTAIVNPPQVGILAVGAMKDRAVVRNGGLHIRKTTFLTLSADHRIIDGLMVARFMETFAAQLAAFSG
jgi:pyruvate dehydrogenase E2 component (dihydrolipoamide acetyltransferase)